MKPGVKCAIGLCGPFAEQGHHDDNQSDNDCTYPEYQALFPGDKGKRRSGVFHHQGRINFPRSFTARIGNVIIQTPLAKGSPGTDNPARL